MINKGESEGITQSDLRPALSINPDLPRRRAELKWKHASADDTSTQACFHVRPTCCSTACRVHNNPVHDPLQDMTYIPAGPRAGA